MRATRVAAVIGFLVTVLVLGSYPAAADTAVFITPGQSGIAVPADDSYAADVTYVAETALQTFTSPAGSAKYTGTFVCIVLRENATGTLDFLYQVAQTGGTDSLDHVSMGDFTGYTTKIGYRDDYPGGVAPVKASRLGAGGTLDFTFTPGTLKNATSEFFYIITNATDYNGSLASVIDNGSVNVNAFEPVPIPPTVLLLGTGLLGLVGLGYRRSRKS